MVLSEALSKRLSLTCSIWRKQPGRSTSFSTTTRVRLSVLRSTPRRKCFHSSPTSILLTLPRQPFLALPLEGQRPLTLSGSRRLANWDPWEICWDHCRRMMPSVCCAMLWLCRKSYTSYVQPQVTSLLSWLPSTLFRGSSWNRFAILIYPIRDGSKPHSHQLRWFGHQRRCLAGTLRLLGFYCR